MEGSRDVSGVASAVCVGGDCTSAMLCGVGRAWRVGQVGGDVA